MLVAILALALGLRLYGIDWDDGGLFHPDERAILMQSQQIGFPSAGEFDDLLSADESPLNPGWFNYGSLPLYALRTLQVAVSPITDWDVFDLRIPGRVISALSDTVTVLLIFAVGARWFGVRVGLLSAALVALAVIHIQLSHFFAVDTILAMFITATVLVLIKVAHRGRRSDAALGGVLFGMAIATKASAAPLVLAFFVAHAVYAFTPPGDRLTAVRLTRQQTRVFLTGGLVSAVAAFVAMVTAQPYMFLDFGQFWTDISRESQMVRGIVDYPYTRQYADTPRYLYQAWQLGVWGLGPALGFAALGGLAAGVFVAWRSRRKTDLVILAWVVPYLAIVGWFDVKFMRYMLPITPFLLLYAARGAWWLADAVRNVPLARRAAGPAVVAVLVVFTAHYALAFESIYAEPHPAQSASQWVSANAPPGATVLKEHWDEGLPELYPYEFRELPLYDPDGQAKLRNVSDSLADADFLVLFSNRLYGTIPRLQDRYPISTAYYETLFSGELGYELAFTEDRRASFLGIGYDADRLARVDLPTPAGFDRPSGINVSFGWADESFTVYDHTRPMVFRNAGRLASGDIEKAIMQQVQPSTPQLGLVLTDDERAIQVANGTFSDIVDLGPGSAGWSWIVWLAAMQGLGVIVLPVGYVLFRPFPNRGYLLHKPLGLLLIAFTAWFMASVGIANFSRVSVVLAIVIWLGIAAAVGWPRRSEILGFLQARWRMVAWMEALFLVAFISFLLVRFANPDLWHPFRGGEKPMDFAYLNAVTRSTVMPPYDPWFAGGYLNYYYFGQFIVATMIRLTGIVPSVAYNLAVPMLFAMTVGGAFTVVHGLVERAQLRPGALATGARSAAVAGLIGALFVAVIGNMDGLYQVAEGTKRVVVDGQAFGDFDYWRSSRMFASDSGGNEITEFPFFSFLFADLHAHMIAIPFALLTLGLGAAAFLRATSAPRGSPASVIGGLAALGLGVGALRIINAWDFPTSMGLAAIAVTAGELLSRNGSLRARLTRGAAGTAFVAAVGFLPFLPFHERYEVDAGLDRNEILSPLWRYMSIHAIFLLAIAAYLAVEVRRLFTSGEASRLATGPLKNAPVTVGVGIAIFTAVLLAIVATGQATLAFALSGAGMLSVLWFIAHRRRAADRMELGIATAVAGVAFGLGAIPELFTVQDDIVRQNTVFKFYLQAWVLFGVASAYLLWRVWAFGGTAFPGAGLLTWPRVRAAGIGVFGVMLAAGLIYPVLATPVRLEDRFNTSNTGIDGAEFLNDAVYFDRNGPLDLSQDMKAIQWIEETIEGSPTIVEGLSGLYRWGNRISVYTGLPAVIGWDWHQRQQRPEFANEVTERRFEVDNFYSTPDRRQAVDLLRKYQVKYVYVGELERTHYPDSGIAKFDDMASDGLTAVYRDGQVAIYEFTGAQTPSVSR